MTGQDALAAIWYELRRLAHLVAEVASEVHDLTERVVRLELRHRDRDE